MQHKMTSWHDALPNKTKRATTSQTHSQTVAWNFTELTSYGYTDSTLVRQKCIPDSYITYTIAFSVYSRQK